MNPRAVVVSGSGRYADPWHPFADTSARIAGVLRGAGFEVEIDERVDARLADVGECELLVVNVGFPDPADEAADAATRAGLLAYLATGRPLLVSHVSSTSFPAMPEWEGVLGGVWVRGTTFHPEYGPSHVEVVDGRHPITAGVADFELLDERYTALRVSPDVHVLAQHTLDGVAHPLLWTHGYGTARVVYDALGHDAASYESPEHRQLLGRAALWLVAPGSTP
ncbi:ThuA domain-containing protein [Gryllotalpicola protaetiae]|uniref:ThuA domain-containing protein n=1 Tax=Gryllotalpicola protaetiae TaxID=2419771 RepID=A0A387BHY4_9MICO|nr:ThuA domain-containing protein [Gryllotalpicola protaetiae]AYG02288.1 ThuA domain-containing protein [Gryllotalpicola protaetiae]